MQPRGGDAIDAAFVFVCLLVSDADQFGQLLLGQSKKRAPFANTAADVLFDFAVVDLVSIHALKPIV